MIFKKSQAGRIRCPARCGHCKIDFFEMGNKLQPGPKQVLPIQYWFCVADMCAAWEPVDPAGTEDPRGYCGLKHSGGTPARLNYLPDVTKAGKA